MRHAHAFGLGAIRLTGGLLRRSLASWAGRLVLPAPEMICQEGRDRAEPIEKRTRRSPQRRAATPRPTKRRY